MKKGKGKIFRGILCIFVAMLLLMPLNATIVNASNPAEKYAIIVAGGASTKLKQTNNCGSSSSSYKGTYVYYKNGFSWSDYTFYVDLRTADTDTGADYFGVMFRYQNGNNYYRLRLKQYYSSDAIYLEKFVNGYHYTISSKSFTVDRNTWYTFKIKLSGNSIQVEKRLSPISWQIIFSVRDSSISRGTIALYSCKDSGAWFDDVLIKTSSMFKDLDFERKKGGQSQTEIFPGPWQKVNDYGTGDWKLSDSQEGGPFVEDQEDFYKECNDVYKKLSNKGYTIRYLSVDRYSDPDNDKKNEVYDIATSSTIEDAFDWMASMSDSNDKCLIYMFDHGMHKTLQPKKGWIYIDNNRDGDRFDSGDRLYDYTVGNWVDGISSYSVLIFVLEACYGGTFTDDVSGSNRIVITSTDYSHEALPLEGTDDPAFSKPFFDRLCYPYNYNFAQAFNYAGGVVDDNPPSQQVGQDPKLDDNGDGIGHSHDVPSHGDGYLAQQTYL